MGVSATGVPLFAGVEDTEDMFLTTMEEMDKEAVDLIDINDPVFQYVKRNKLIEYRSSIGTHIPVKLLARENSTVKDFSHYDDVDNTPQDALDEAKFAYGHIVGTQMYSREEMVKNSGPEQLINLVETKKEQLTSSMTNHFSTRIKGTQEADGRMAMGLGRIVTYGATCGGIDPTTPGFGYWNPQRMLKAAGTQYALATEMREGIRKLSRLCTYQGEKPDFFRCGEDVYDAAQAWAEGKLQMRMDEIKDSSGWGDFEMFSATGKTYVYDADMPAKGIELYNMKRCKVRVHAGTNFVFEAWQMMQNKVAKKRDCLVYYGVYCKRRNVNGVGLFT